MADEVTMEGKARIERWKAAQLELSRAKSALNSAETELKNTTDDLAKWLRPEDATEEEVICVWYGDSLIQSKRVRGFNEITVRKRGKSLLA